MEHIVPGTRLKIREEQIFSDIASAAFSRIILIEFLANVCLLARLAIGFKKPFQSPGDELLNSGLVILKKISLKLNS